MTQDLQSFLIAVGVILALTLLVPCIESIATFVRRRRAQSATESFSEQESRPSLYRETA